MYDAEKCNPQVYNTRMEIMLKNEKEKEKGQEQKEKEQIFSFINYLFGK